MWQRLRRWMLSVTVAVALSATIPQLAFAEEEPLQPNQVPCGCPGSPPPPKKCKVSNSQPGLLQPGNQCGW
jgi:hypothetical protein